MGRNTKEEEKKLKAMDKRRDTLKAAEEAPVEISFSMRKEAGTTWQFITYHTQNGKVIKTEVKECMDKMHAIETYKLAFVSAFIEGR